MSRRKLTPSQEVNGIIHPNRLKQPIEGMNGSEIWAFIEGRIPRVAQEWLAKQIREANRAAFDAGNLDREIKTVKDNLEAEMKRTQVMSDRLTKQERLIERLWIHKVIACLKAITHVSPVQPDYHHFTEKMARAALRDMPATLHPDWEGDRAG